MSLPIDCSILTQPYLLEKNPSFSIDETDEPLTKPDCAHPRCSKKDQLRALFIENGICNENGEVNSEVEQPLFHVLSSENPEDKKILIHISEAILKPSISTTINKDKIKNRLDKIDSYRSTCKKTPLHDDEIPSPFTFTFNLQKTFHSILDAEKTGPLQGKVAKILIAGQMGEWLLMKEWFSRTGQHLFEKFNIKDKLTSVFQDPIIERGADIDFRILFKKENSTNGEQELKELTHILYKTFAEGLTNTLDHKQWKKFLLDTKHYYKTPLPSDFSDEQLQLFCLKEFSLTNYKPLIKEQCLVLSVMSDKEIEIDLAIFHSPPSQTTCLIGEENTHYLYSTDSLTLRIDSLLTEKEEDKYLVVYTPVGLHQYFIDRMTGILRKNPHIPTHETHLPRYIYKALQKSEHFLIPKETDSMIRGVLAKKVECAHIYISPLVSIHHVTDAHFLSALFKKYYDKHKITNPLLQKGLLLYLDQILTLYHPLQTSVFIDFIDRYTLSPSSHSPILSFIEKSLIEDKLPFAEFSAWMGLFAPLFSSDALVESEKRFYFELSMPHTKNAIKLPIALDPTSSIQYLQTHVQELNLSFAMTLYEMWIKEGDLLEKKVGNALPKSSLFPINFEYLQEVADQWMGNKNENPFFCQLGILLHLFIPGQALSKAVEICILRAVPYALKGPSILSECLLNQLKKEGENGRLSLLIQPTSIEKFQPLLIQEEKTDETWLTFLLSLHHRELTELAYAFFKEKKGDHWSCSLQLELIQAVMPSQPALAFKLLNSLSQQTSFPEKIKILLIHTQLICKHSYLYNEPEVIVCVVNKGIRCLTNEKLRHFKYRSSVLSKVVVLLNVLYELTAVHTHLEAQYLIEQLEKVFLDFLVKEQTLTSENIIAYSALEPLINRWIQDTRTDRSLGFLKLYLRFIHPTQGIEILTSVLKTLWEKSIFNSAINEFLFSDEVKRLLNHMSPLFFPLLYEYCQQGIRQSNILIGEVTHFYFEMTGSFTEKTIHTIEQTYESAVLLLAAAPLSKKFIRSWVKKYGMPVLEVFAKQKDFPRLLQTLMLDPSLINQETLGYRLLLCQQLNDMKVVSTIIQPHECRSIQEPYHIASFHKLAVLCLEQGDIKKAVQWLTLFPQEYDELEKVLLQFLEKVTVEAQFNNEIIYFLFLDRTMHLYEKDPQKFLPLLQTYCQKGIEHSSYLIEDLMDAYLTVACQHYIFCYDAYCLLLKAFPLAKTHKKKWLKEYHLHALHIFEEKNDIQRLMEMALLEKPNFRAESLDYRLRLCLELKSDEIVAQLLDPQEFKTISFTYYFEIIHRITNYLISQNQLKKAFEWLSFCFTLKLDTKNKEKLNNLCVACVNPLVHAKLFKEANFVLTNYHGPFEKIIGLYQVFLEGCLASNATELGYRLLTSSRFEEDWNPNDLSFLKVVTEFAQYYVEDTTSDLMKVLSLITCYDLTDSLLWENIFKAVYKEEDHIKIKFWDLFQDIFLRIYSAQLLQKSNYQLREISLGELCEVIFKDSNRMPLFSEIFITVIQSKLQKLSSWTRAWVWIFKNLESLNYSSIVFYLEQKDFIDTLFASSPSLKADANRSILLTSIPHIETEKEAIKVLQLRHSLMIANEPTTIKELEMDLKILSKMLDLKQMPLCLIAFTGKTICYFLNQFQTKNIRKVCGGNTLTILDSSPLSNIVYEKFSFDDLYKMPLCKSILLFLMKHSSLDYLKAAHQFLNQYLTYYRIANCISELRPLAIKLIKLTLMKEYYSVFEITQRNLILSCKHLGFSEETQADLWPTFFCNYFSANSLRQQPERSSFKKLKTMSTIYYATFDRMILTPQIVKHTVDFFFDSILTSDFSDETYHQNKEALMSIMDDLSLVDNEFLQLTQEDWKTWVPEYYNWIYNKVLEKTKLNSPALNRSLVRVFGRFIHKMIRYYNNQIPTSSDFLIIQQCTLDFYHKLVYLLPPWNSLEKPSLDNKEHDAERILVEVGINFLFELVAKKLPIKPLEILPYALYYSIKLDYNDQKQLIVDGGSLNKKIVLKISNIEEEKQVIKSLIKKILESGTPECLLKATTTIDRMAILFTPEELEGFIEPLIDSILEMIRHYPLHEIEKIPLLLYIQEVYKKHNKEIFNLPNKMLFKEKVISLESALSLSLSKHIRILDDSRQTSLEECKFVSEELNKILNDFFKFRTIGKIHAKNVPNAMNIILFSFKFLIEAGHYNHLLLATHFFEILFIKKDDSLELKEIFLNTLDLWMDTLFQIDPTSVDFSDHLKQIVKHARNQFNQPGLEKALRKIMNSWQKWKDHRVKPVIYF